MKAVKKAVDVTGFFHQCEVKFGVKPVVNACSEILELEQKKGDTIVSYFRCVNCGTMFSVTYKQVTVE